MPSCGAEAVTTERGLGAAPATGRPFPATLHRARQLLSQSVAEQSDREQTPQVCFGAAGVRVNKRGVVRQSQPTGKQAARPAKRPQQRPPLSRLPPPGAADAAAPAEPRGLHQGTEPTQACCGRCCLLEVAWKATKPTMACSHSSVPVAGSAGRTRHWTGPPCAHLEDPAHTGR